MRFTLTLLRRWNRPPPTPPEYQIAETTKKYANLPEKYMEDTKKLVYYRTPRGINYRPKKLNLFQNYIGVARPWSAESPQEISEADGFVPYVEPLRDWFFFRGDRVQILTGKDKGKQGIIDMVIQERNWVIIRGLNTEIVPQKDDDDSIIGYSSTERPLLVNTQVSLVDPGDLLPTEVEWSWTEEGEKVRVSKRTGRIIPMSRRNEETFQYQSKETYAENAKDTRKEDMQITFAPKLMTFEMEIAQELGIEDDRIPKKTYWY